MMTDLRGSILILLLSISVICFAGNSEKDTQQLKLGKKPIPGHDLPSKFLSKDILSYNPEAASCYEFIRLNPNSDTTEQEKIRMFELSLKPGISKVTVSDVWAYPIGTIYNNTKEILPNRKQAVADAIIPEAGRTNYVIHLTLKPAERMKSLLGANVMIRMGNSVSLISHFREWNYWIAYDLDVCDEFYNTELQPLMILFSLPSVQTEKAVLYIYGKAYPLEDILIP